MKPNNKKGFSLLEIVLYVALSAITIFVTSTLFSLVVKTKAKQEAITEVSDQGSLVMRTFTQAIRNARSVNIAVGSSSDTITLTMEESSRNPTVFSISGDVIEIEEGSGAQSALTTSRVRASGLSFQNLGPSTPGTIQIRFTLDALNPSDRKEYSHTQTFYGSANIRQ